MAGRSRKLAAVPEEAAQNERKLLPAVEETLGKLELAPEDAAAARLALGYARTIDQAAAIAAQAAKIPHDPDTADEVKRLAAKVSAHTTMADLGPKLLAVLDALGATPKARAAAGVKPGKSTGSASALHQLRSGGVA